MKFRIYFVTLLFISVFTNTAHAADGNLLFNISHNVIGLMEGFTISLYGAVGAVYKKLFLLICLIAFPLISYAFLQGKVTIENLVTFVISLNIISAIAFNADTFVNVVYQPFFAGVYKFCAFIANKVGGSGYGGEGVNGMFNGIYMSISSFSDIIDKLVDENEDFSWFDVKDGIIIIVTVFIIKLVFFVLCAIFVAFFTLTIVRAHIIVIVMPITLSLMPFQSMRPYGFNHFKLLLREGLTVLIYVISISISVYLVSQLGEMADKLNEAEDILDFSFVVAAITTPMLGLVLMFSASGLAASILNAVGGGNVLSGRALTQIATAGATVGAVAATNIGNISRNVPSIIRNRFGNNSNNNIQQKPNNIAANLGVGNYGKSGTPTNFN